ncbi:TonB-dependent receptor [Aliiglaciecola sp. CAU 1673]|uniref:TonB-dependent receptor plug domain-containing protein n=1 Tax=Aliiglaciecola sp. CAU 1673 TaxID=3032595 RepID=UPI0023D98F59|nr:TonB-dependent receptor [Aliiglaciecola sp. CAU 1673]MDF2177545.1 TonB-dependent receptor [Aliiglaciecola sp. CAU 1673]
MSKVASPLACLFFVLYCSPLWAQRADPDELFSLSFDDLFDVKVKTASNIEERIADAPATVIVIDKTDVALRGYENLSEVLDDLPGMEMVRPYGDTYFVNYMRGYRYTIGTPYLVMIDGVVFNSLYFSITTAMAALPLSNIDRIEVVYGPASSVYGANAFMGVINIITKHPSSDSIDRVVAHNRIGTDGSFIADYSAFHEFEKFAASIAVRYESADLKNRIDNNSTYWLRDEHYENKALWGAFTTPNGLGEGRFSSDIRNIGLDARLFIGDLELAAQYALEDSGYGTVYPADKILSNSPWPLFQYSVYARLNKKLSERVNSKTLLRYRADGVDNDSYDVEAWNVTNDSDMSQDIGGITLMPGEAARMLHFQYWLTESNSWSLFQDFDITWNDKLSLVTGAKYEIKDLQKAYFRTFSGPISPLLSEQGVQERLPSPPADAYADENNRVEWRDVGVYVQSKYRLNDKDSINAGIRWDNNNVYGSNINVRAAYVRNSHPWNLKFLYGEAYQEPTPRSLYGAWTGSGSEPSLKPESSRTLEASARYSAGNSSHLVTLYKIFNEDTVINFTGGARNAGSRQILGLDYHFSYQPDSMALRPWKLSAYASYYLDTEEEQFESLTGDLLGNSAIGDLAKLKLWALLQWQRDDSFNVNLTARYVGERDTVSSNPVHHIPSYFTVDLNLGWKAVLIDNLDLSFRVINLLDKEYYHPGIREADAGAPDLEPELLSDIGFDQDNPLAWNGSLGWYNSRLPQPGRRAVFSFSFRF